MGQFWFRFGFYEKNPFGNDPLFFNNKILQPCFLISISYFRYLRSLSLGYYLDMVAKGEKVADIFVKGNIEILMWWVNSDFKFGFYRKNPFGNDHLFLIKKPCSPVLNKTRWWLIIFKRNLKLIMLFRAFSRINNGYLSRLTNELETDQNLILVVP